MGTSTQPPGGTDIIEGIPWRPSPGLCQSLTAGACAALLAGGEKQPAVPAGASGGRIWGKKMEGAEAHRKVFRGSKASRTPSKMKTRRESMVAKVKKAVKPSHGALRRFLPCSASSPREG